MSNKLNILMEILGLLEDDKVRMSTFINPEVFGSISDEERKKWYARARGAENTYQEFYYSNRALGYDHAKAKALAVDAIKKERDKVSGEHVLNRGKKDDDENRGEGVAGVAGEKEASIERKDAIKKFISNVKTEFKDYPGADSVLSVLLIQHGFDELIPKSSIPSYDHISKLIRDLEASGKTKWKSTPISIITAKPPDGLGIPQRTYYKVMDYIKQHANVLRHNESFLTGLTSLFAKEKGQPKEKTFKLSNMEPMVDIIRRDMDRSPFKYHGLHIQGLMKEHGEDMFTDLPNVQHQYGGTALIIPIGSNTNLNQVLKKSIPGKKVFLFGFNKQSQPLRKGWEGFTYKTVDNPTLIGSYALSSESKAESLLRDFREGFQCCNYQHASGSCDCGRGACHWQGFPSVGEDMERECPDYNRRTDENLTEVISWINTG